MAYLFYQTYINHHCLRILLLAVLVGTIWVPHHAPLVVPVFVFFPIVFNFPKSYKFLQLQLQLQIFVSGSMVLHLFLYLKFCNLKNNAAPSSSNCWLPVVHCICTTTYDTSMWMRKGITMQKKTGHKQWQRRGKQSH